MKYKLKLLFLNVYLLISCSVFGQNVLLYQQFNGHFDFTFVGNTMNLGENNITPGCADLLVTASSATLNLGANQTVEKAYLYWAGSGLGDFNVKLNTVDITPQRTFINTNIATSVPYFSAFADVTTFVQTTGNGVYTLSDLDVSQTLNTVSGYCARRTNFAGWAMIIVYKDSTLPNNQINIYDGLQSIPTSVNITLDSLNVIDNNNAKIGFISWEGDGNLAVDETLKFNGTTLSDPPLNPANNVFNGTNSITGSNTLYNMDLDIFSIQNTINVGDTSALIELTSGQDVVLINAVVTKLNNALPDATIVIENVIKSCNSKTITVNYTVSNNNADSWLPTNTPIAVYANGVLVGQTQTNAIIPIGGSESGQITVTLPEAISLNYNLQIVVDDNGVGVGVVPEIDENNNTFSETVSLLSSPNFNNLEPLVVCNEGSTKGTFNFLNYNSDVLSNASDVFVGYYNSLSDAENQINPIVNTTHYIANTTPKEIFIRIKNDNCYAITSFFLTTKNCPPTAFNIVTANNDGVNDTLHFDGLRNVFLNFELQIYNRWGQIIWTGNNNTDDWNGFSNKGILFDKNEVTTGTYYYVLNLNDDNYPEPIVGWFYFRK